ncbi:MAG TPA: hypothetical protein VK400_16750 [Pyrinomonadaceae bacterium]|nr:hypothetical protein [Pyrinomonadaceae bacterium]
MYGIKIQDSRKTASGGNSLNFDLRDVLAVIGEPARKARWRGRDIWCTASRNGKAVSIREERRDFSGEEFFQFASSIHQTIDGRFEVRREDAAKKSWLVIVAFDSSWFEVWSSKPEVIEKLRNHFEKVSDLTKTAA